MYYTSLSGVGVLAETAKISLSASAERIFAHFRYPKAVFVSFYGKIPMLQICATKMPYLHIFGNKNVVIANVSTYR